MQLGRAPRPLTSAVPAAPVQIRRARVSETAAMRRFRARCASLGLSLAPADLLGLLLDALLGSPQLILGLSLSLLTAPFPADRGIPCDVSDGLLGPPGDLVDDAHVPPQGSVVCGSVVAKGLDELSLAHRGAALDADLLGALAKLILRPVLIAAGLAALLAGPSPAYVGDACGLFLALAALAQLLVLLRVLDTRTVVLLGHNRHLHGRLAVAVPVTSAGKRGFASEFAFGGVSATAR